MILAVLLTIVLTCGILFLVSPLVERSEVLTVRGVDISFTLRVEQIGRQVSDNGRTKPIEEILAGHGANYARLRVWVDPADGTNDLASTLILARRAREAGMQLLLNLHYSDVWADRTNQQVPAAWSTLHLDQLTRTVEAYTREVVAALSNQGTPPDMVQIGNEVVHGMLWPAGRVYHQSGADWSAFAKLLNAGAKGAREGNSAQPPAIVLHTDTGGDAAGTAYFFDQLEHAGVSFDVIALSYYPFWHGSLTDLRLNVNHLAERFDKDILIAETAYPWTLSSAGNCPSVVSNVDALPDADEFPPTPQGQHEFFLALGEVMREVPEHHGLGYIVWEPGWLAGVPADSRTCNSHTNLTLFDFLGEGLPALNTLARNAPREVDPI